MIQKTADVIGDLIGNKIRKALKNSQENNSEIVANENDKEIHKERCISPEERKGIN